MHPILNYALSSKKKLNKAMRESIACVLRTMTVKRATKAWHCHDPRKNLPYCGWETPLSNHHRETTWQGPSHWLLYGGEPSLHRAELDESTPKKILPQSFIILQKDFSKEKCRKNSQLSPPRPRSSPKFNDSTPNDSTSSEVVPHGLDPHQNLMTPHQMTPRVVRKNAPWKNSH